MVTLSHLCIRMDNAKGHYVTPLPFVYFSEKMFSCIVQKKRPTPNPLVPLLAYLSYAYGASVSLRFRC
jgi:hypothetical protein